MSVEAFSEEWPAGPRVAVLLCEAVGDTAERDDVGTEEHWAPRPWVPERCTVIPHGCAGANSAVSTSADEPPIPLTILVPPALDRRKHPSTWKRRVA